MSKSHPQQWQIVTQVDRPDPASVAALARFPTTQIADSAGPVSVVDPPIRWLAGGTEICGPAVTLWIRPGDILFLLKSPDLVTEGDVLIIDGGGREDAAVVGDIVSGYLAQRVCRGIIVDGAVRDTDGIDEVGLPVFGRNTYPTTGSNVGPGAINVPIQCGGVAVHPGDIVRADRSGVVIVPKDQVADVLAATQVVADREAGWRSALADGSNISTVMGLDEQIDRLRAAALHTRH